MRDLVILFIHLLTAVARLERRGGVRSVIAELLLVKDQLLSFHRSRQRAPNLRLSDRLVTGWCTLLVPPSRLIRSTIVLKASTLLHLHQILTKRKYRLLFTRKAGTSPLSQGPSKTSLTPSSPSDATPPGAAHESFSRLLARSASPSIKTWCDACWPPITTPIHLPAILMSRHSLNQTVESRDLVPRVNLQRARGRGPLDRCKTPAA